MVVLHPARNSCVSSLATTIQISCKRTFYHSILPNSSVQIHGLPTAYQFEERNNICIFVQQNPNLFINIKWVNDPLQNRVLIVWSNNPN